MYNTFLPTSYINLMAISYIRWNKFMFAPKFGNYPNVMKRFFNMIYRWYDQLTPKFKVSTIFTWTEHVCMMRFMAWITSATAHWNLVLTSLGTRFNVNHVLQEKSNHGVLPYKTNPDLHTSVMLPCFCGFRRGFCSAKIPGRQKWRVTTKDRQELPQSFCIKMIISGVLVRWERKSSIRSRITPKYFISSYKILLNF